MQKELKFDEYRQGISTFRAEFYCSEREKAKISLIFATI